MAFKNELSPPLPYKLEFPSGNASVACFKQDTQGCYRQDVVWGGVDIKTGLYTNYVYKPINMLTGRLMITAE